jgi:hypothetical protein
MSDVLIQSEPLLETSMVFNKYKTVKTIAFERKFYEIKLLKFFQ